MKFHLALQIYPRLQKPFKEFFKEKFAKDPYGTDCLKFANSPLSPCLIEELHKKFGYIYSSASEKNGIYFNSPEHQDLSLYYWEDIYSDSDLEETIKRYGHKILYHLHDDWSEIRPFFDNLQNEFRGVLTGTVKSSGQVPEHEHYCYDREEPLLKKNEHGFHLYSITLFHYLYSEFWEFQKNLEVIDRQSLLESCSRCQAFFYLKGEYRREGDNIFCTKNCKMKYKSHGQSKIPRHLKANT